MPTKRNAPKPPARHVEAEPMPLGERTTTLPPADRVVGGGETADGVPFLVRANDGTTIELATATGTKPRTAAKADAASFREVGSASPSPFTSQLRRDANTDLAGQKGIAKY